MFNDQYPTKEAWAIKKKRKKMACPRSMTQNKEKIRLMKAQRKKGK